MIRKNEEVKYDNTIQNKIIKNNFDDFTREDTKKNTIQTGLKFSFILVAH